MSHSQQRMAMLSGLRMLSVGAGVFQGPSGWIFLGQSIIHFIYLIMSMRPRDETKFMAIAVGVSPLQHHCGEVAAFVFSLSYFLKIVLTSNEWADFEVL
jgi:hypothetical protein